MVKPSFPLQEKFQALEDRLNIEVFERHDVVAATMLALVSGLHVFQMGEPGIAKSLLFDKLRSHIGGLMPGDYFKHLLTKYSTPDELFGPPDISALKQGRYRRVDTLTMLVAKLVFLDEIWKGSSSILNTNLTLVNEREYKNDGQILPAPLWSLFCASNELPEGQELIAMYDRIHFRFVVESLSEQGNFIQMLQLSSLAPVGEIITWDEIMTASKEAAKVEITDEVYNAMNQIRNDLRIKEIRPSDRRFAEAIKVVRASAWRRGDTVAEVNDLHPLSDMFWDDPKDAPIVRALLLSYTSPHDQEAQELIDEVERIDSKMTALKNNKDLDEYLAQQEGLELYGKAKACKREFDKLQQGLSEAGRSSARMNKLRSSLMNLMDRMMTQVFEVKDPVQPS